ncbi:proline-rich protein 2-like [Equus przewalskii]|uniref:Proline-rich protein 2-like n=1 Tax=Equus przewalskii TaxID=9798 RepID=A0ABM4Q3V9_EQUPR
MAVPGTQSSLLLWPVAPSFIPQGRPAPNPSRAATIPAIPTSVAGSPAGGQGRSEARTHPPGLGPLLRCLVRLPPPPSAARAGGQTPLSGRARRWGCRGPRAPGMPVPRRLHLWGPVPGSHPPGCASAPPAQPRRARPEGRRVPRGRPCAQTHRPTVPARYLRVRAPAPRPAAGPPLPRPFPSRKPRAPSGRARGGQSVRTRPPTGLGRAPAPGPALAAPPPAGLGPRPVNSSREAGRRSQRRGAPKGGDRAAPPSRPAASDGPPPPGRPPGTLGTRERDPG